MTTYRYIMPVPHLSDEDVAQLTQEAIEEYERLGVTDVSFGPAMRCSHGQHVGIVIQAVSDMALEEFPWLSKTQPIAQEIDGMMLPDVEAIEMSQVTGDEAALIAALFGTPDSRFSAAKLFS